MVVKKGGGLFGVLGGGSQRSKYGREGGRRQSEEGVKGEMSERVMSPPKVDKCGWVRKVWMGCVCVGVW